MLPIKKLFHSIFLILLVSLTACQSHQNRHHLDSNCNASFAEYERRKTPERLKQESKAIMGNITSYTLNAGMIVTETVLYIGGGVVVGALICSPLIAIEVAADSDGTASVECVIRIGSHAASVIIQESEYSLSKKVWDSTESIRVTSYDALVVHLLDSVECRIDSGNPAELKIAHKQLQALTRDKNITQNLTSFTLNRSRLLSERIQKSRANLDTNIN